tara:strand:+ start:122 stop:304 length:183 start_codon:yes stop_codon:yes gene_type:complete
MKTDREFELEQLRLAVDFFERQLEDHWYTEKANNIERNINKFKNKYEELKKWTTKKEHSI